MEELREKLKTVRETLKMSQREFARELDVSFTLVNLIEKGEKEITTKTLRKLVENLGVSEDWLRTGKEPMFIDREKRAMDFLQKEYKLSSQELELAKSWFKLPKGEREIINRAVSFLMGKTDKAD